MTKPNSKITTAVISILIAATLVMLSSCRGRSGSDPVNPAGNAVSLSDPDSFLVFLNRLADAAEELLAGVYYPVNEKTTLAEWKVANGFDASAANQGADFLTIFRDVRDIGYGRRVYWKLNNVAGGTCDLAVYVDNYQVTIPGQPGLEYGTVNLDAAVVADANHHIGSNAIEVCGTPAVARFYTFSPGTGARLESVNFDGRGQKAVPVICASCHGSLNLSDGGDIRAQLLPIEVDEMEFSPLPGISRVDYEAALKTINAAILATYPVGASLISGQWDGTLAKELIEGWYGGPGMPDDVFDGSFVPAGWQHDPGDDIPPATAPELYRSVVGPHCMVCHAQEGTTLYRDINFSTYEKFISYADDIRTLVFDEGRMPLGLLNYQAFWSDPEKPNLLYTDLGFMPPLAAGVNIPEPGKPIARPGADRTTISPAQLDGSNSLFADSFEWEIISPLGMALLSDVAIAQPMLTGLDGVSPAPDATYEIALIVANGSRSSEAASVMITIDSTLIPLPANLRFFDDVADSLGGCLGSFCHSGSSVGIPVVFESNPNLYPDTLSRVNLENPGESLLLKKASGFHHSGGTPWPEGSAAYNMILNWISEGALEGP